MYSKNPKHILELSSEEKNEFLNSFDIVMSDCDGTLWMLSEPIPNVGASINLLKNAGKQFKFVTGNGMRSDEEHAQKLAKIGANGVLPEDFLVPYKAISRYIELNYPNEICYCMCSDTFFKMLRSKGIRAENITPSMDITFSQMSTVCAAIPTAKLVIMDIHIHMSYIEMALLHEYMMKKDCIVFVNQLDDRVPVTKDLTILGPGHFLTTLPSCKEKEFVIYGKPSDIMGDFLLNETGLKDRKRGLFIGDNIFADVQFGNRLGFQTLFVLNGAHTKEEMLLQPPDNQPDYYADSLGDFVEFFNNLEVNGKK
ncbi:uncharacterized protein LOC142231052 [Haematobia irritans]|uniref:uncharacterized protein LOC142231052 n=1 Tax=Haematobia irritans TaxID=7368 RepID=UPI003F50C6DE